MTELHDNTRPWEVSVTSSDPMLIESLGQPAPELGIETGPIRRFPGATDTVLQILGLIRDVDFGVLSSLIAAWLYQKSVTSPQDPPSGSSKGHAPAVSEPRRRVRAHVRIHNQRWSLDVEVNVDADSPQDVKTEIEKELRDAGHGK
jgi:hypothetical protein